MKQRDIFDLVTLGLLWGLGFLFIRMSVSEFGAVVLIEVRMLLAAIVLLPLVIARRQLREMLAHWQAIALMGVIHYALPFCLFAWAMLTLPAGYSSVVNAASPIFAGIVARAWIGERLPASRLAGLLLGLGGVVVLVWDKLSADSAATGPALAAAVAGAFCYGFAAVFAKRKLAGVSPLAVAGGSMAAAGLVLLPAAILLWPGAMPSVMAWSMTALLGVLSTAIAFVLYYRLIASVGPSRAISVTFLIPVFAMLLGVLFANEAINAAMVAGGLVIALGTALATGMLDAGAMLRRGGALAVRSMLVLVAITVTVFWSSEARAAEGRLPVYLSANTFASRPADSWRSFTTMALGTEFEHASANRSRAVTAFAEYHFADDTRVDGTTVTGISAAYRQDRWDVTAYWFVLRFPGTSGEQQFKGRLRHRLGERHKLSLEYTATVDAVGGGELALGYAATLRPGVTMKLQYGTDLEQRGRQLARVGLSWQLR